MQGSTMLARLPHAVTPSIESHSLDAPKAASLLYAFTASQRTYKLNTMMQCQTTSVQIAVEWSHNQK